MFHGLAGGPLGVHRGVTTVPMPSKVKEFVNEDRQVLAEQTRRLLKAPRDVVRGAVLS